MINELAEKVHKNAKDKGFFEGEKNIGEMIALIHSEVSEALEADRKDKKANKPKFEDDMWSKWRHLNNPDKQFQESFKEHIKDSFEDELADVMIRVMDLAAFRGINLEYHIHTKMKYNSLREYKHGKKY